MNKLGLLAVITIFPFAAHANAITQASADIVDSSNRIIGKAELFQGTDGVVVKFNVKGLKSGYHGMHFHQTGDCSDYKAGFKKSNDFLMSENREHGLLSDKGPHAGDLPNLYFHTDGTGIAEFYTEMVSLDG